MLGRLVGSPHARVNNSTGALGLRGACYPTFARRAPRAGGQPMGWWSRIFGATPARPVPAAHPALPDGVRMSAEVVRWAQPGYPADVLVAVSDGLAAVGQREIGLAVRLGPGTEPDACRTELAQIFATFRSFAARGQTVGAGDVSVFGARGPFGSRVGGLAYVENLGRCEWYPQGTLVGMMLAPDEARLAHRAGVYRVLARCGSRARCFPFPPFFDASLPSVAYPGDDESLPARLPRASIPGLTLTRSPASDDVVVSIPRASVDACDRLVRSAVAGQPFALHAEPAPDADAWAVWRPGQVGPEVTTTSTAYGKVGLWHLVVAPGGDADELRLREDGAAALLTAGTWGRLADVLEAGRPLVLRPRDMALRLEWR